METEASVTQELPFLLTQDPFCDGPVRTYRAQEEVPDVLRPYIEPVVVGSSVTDGLIFAYNVPERIAKVLL